MSARSNEDRLGAPEVVPSGPDSSAPAPLKFITPTEFVELPSEGLYYPPGHSLHNQKVVEIKHMTTKEEDILTSAALLKSGLAIERMLESIIVNKNIKTSDMLLGDKNALIIAARAHGYGATFETAVDCPSCGANQNYTFDLSSLEIKKPSPEDLKEKEVTKTENNTFLIPLPESDYNIEVRLLNGHDEKKLNDAAEHKRKRNLPDTAVTDFLRAIIVSVNNISDANSLNGFINTLPAIYGRYVRKTYDILVPVLDLEHPFVCAECNFEGTSEVPLTSDFFWPNA